MNNRIRSIEAFRFFFMLIICIWHYERPNYLMHHGYLCVDFFFVLSGMLLYNTFCKKSVGVFDYTLNKIKKFYPEYFTCMLILYGGKIINGKQLTINELYQFISESMMLQSLGIWENGLNPPSWYISVLIYGGAIVFAILKYNKELAVNVIFPIIIIIIGYTFIFNKGNRIEIFGNSMLINYPLLRGICDMVLGVLTMIVYKKLSDLPTNEKTIINIISLFSLFLFINEIIDIQSKDSYSLIFIPIILISFYMKDSIFNKVFKSILWEKLGSITYEMLIIHIPCRFILNNIGIYTFIDDSFKLLVYLLFVVSASIMLKIFNNNILSKIRFI